MTAHKRAISRWNPSIYSWGRFTDFFGDHIEQAVKQYQLERGIEPTGRIGRATHEALDRAHRKGSQEWAFDQRAINLAHSLLRGALEDARRDRAGADRRWDCSGVVTACYEAGGAPDRSGDHAPRLSGLAAAVSSIPRRLFEPVDIASIVAFRITFGAILMWEVYRYFDHGWIDRYYVDPTFHFTYLGFGWVEPWPGNWMHVHFVGLAVLALCIMIGFGYRAATVLFFLGFTYIFLLEQARYLNHFYFVSLIALCLVAVPAHRAVSVDARLWPHLRSPVVPRWALGLLRFQVAVVFVFAGIAKLNRDWLRGEPLRELLANRTDFFLIGSLFTKEWLVYLFSYGGLLFDLLVVPLLLWPRTRPFAFAAALLFTLFNSKFFKIGIFPWISLGATLLFFPPNWPRHLLARLGLKPVSALPVSPARRRLGAAQRVGVGLLGAYAAIQILVPLRHFLYPGNVSWTEEGHQFAWRQKLRGKKSKARFFAFMPDSGERRELDTSSYVTGWQYWKMSARPDMILQLGHLLARELRRQGLTGFEIRAEVVSSLHGRPFQFLIDPEVDLAKKRRTILGADWIVSLRES